MRLSFMQKTFCKWVEKCPVSTFAQKIGGLKYVPRYLKELTDFSSRVDNNGFCCNHLSFLEARFKGACLSTTAAKIKINF